MMKWRGIKLVLAIGREVMKGKKNQNPMYALLIDYIIIVSAVVVCPFLLLFLSIIVNNDFQTPLSTSFSLGLYLSAGQVQTR